MGELILCRQPIAAVPFYIESVSLNVYSLEELCYYIFHNTDVVGPELVSDELLDWISDQLRYKDLSERLAAGRAAGIPFHVQIETILSSCGYLTPKEIKDTVRSVMLEAGLSPVEKKKRKADTLLKSGQMRKAITAYQRILGSEELKRDVYGDICHDIGYAYAKLFMFEEAADWYRKAYEHNTATKSLMQLLFSLMELGDSGRISELAESYHIRDEELERAKRVYEAANTSKKIREEQKKAEETDADVIISRLKTEYVKKYGA